MNKTKHATKARLYLCPLENTSCIRQV